MYKTVCRVETVTRSEIGRFTYHNIRTPDHAERYAGQEHIRTEDMHKNKILLGTNEPTKDIQQAIKNVKMARAAKGGEGQDIVAQEIILSAHSEFFNELSEAQIGRWENANLEFLRKRFPGDNLISVVSHRDEKAPHIHAIVVPIVESKRKKGEMVLNATEYLGNRGSELRALKKQGRAHESTLGKLQTEYTNAMQRAGFNLERGDENSKTKHVAVDIFRQAVEPVKEVLKKTKNELAKEVDTLKKVTDARNEVVQNFNQGKTALQQISTSVEQKKAELLNLEKTFNDGKKNYDELLKRYENGEGHIKKQEEKLADIEKELVQKKAELGVLRQEKETTFEQSELVKNELGNIKKELVERKDELKKAEAELSKLKSEAEKINIGKLRVEAANLRYKIVTHPSSPPPFVFDYLYKFANHMGMGVAENEKCVWEFLTKLDRDDAYRVFGQAQNKDELKKAYDKIHDEERVRQNVARSFSRSR